MSFTTAGPASGDHISQVGGRKQGRKKEYSDNKSISKINKV